MTALYANGHRRFSALPWRSATRAAALLAVVAMATVHASPQSPKPDASSSREAFLQVYKVFTSPRCQNCHPPGDSPLQGDDSHVHLQNVSRGKDGYGAYDMASASCHLTTNLPDEPMPPAHSNSA